ncbi:SDR family NAD(P)-dependent oxidoreductase [bacterium]|nr:SDR family NAD(P)-dependent oxidoreductase [bacterium]
MTGKKPYKNQSAYCASKFAIVGFSKVLAVEAQECRNCYFSSENKKRNNN